MRREREDAPRAERAQLVRGRGQRARRVDHVVDDDAVAALHRADEVHRADDARLRPLLQDDGERDLRRVRQAAEALHERLGARDAARVRADHDGLDQVLHVEIGHGDRRGEQVVHGRPGPEEALDLGAVQVHAHDAVDAHGLHHPRDVGRRDGHAAPVLAVLARVPVVRHHRGHGGRRRAPRRRHQEEQLDQVVVHRGARRLQDVDVRAAHAVAELDVDLAVVEAAHLRRREGHAQPRRDLLGEGLVRGPRHELHLEVVRRLAVHDARHLEPFQARVQPLGLEDLAPEPRLEVRGLGLRRVAQAGELVVLLHDLLEALRVQPDERLQLPDLGVQVDGVAPVVRRRGRAERVARRAPRLARLERGERRVELADLLQVEPVHLLQLLLQRREEGLLERVPLVRLGAADGLDLRLERVVGDVARRPLRHHAVFEVRAELHAVQLVPYAFCGASRS